MAHKERRSNRRFNVAPILCRLRPPNAIGVLRNVSVEGAFLLNGEPPEVGSTCEIEFAEPPLSGYRLEGTVVRHGRIRFSSGFAVRFFEPHPKLLRAVYHTQ